MAQIDNRSTRWVVGWLWVALPPALILIDSGLAYFEGWRSMSGRKLTILLTCGSLALLALAVGAAIFAGGRAWLHERRHAIALFMASTLLGVTGGELLVRYAARQVGLPTPHSRGANIRRKFEPDPWVMPGMARMATYSTGSLGVRPGDPPASARRRALCIGASTTESVYLDDAMTWYAQASSLLNQRGQPWWLGGLGISGYTTIEHLDLLARRRLPLSVDLVVVTAGINDFVRFLNGSLEEAEWPHWRRLELTRLAFDVHRSRFLSSSLVTIEDRAGHNLVARRAQRANSRVRVGMPDLTGAVARFGARMEQLVAACNRHGVECILITQPVLWAPELTREATDLLWMGADAEGAYYRAEELRRGMDLYNRETLAVCRRFGLRCLDLSSMNGVSGWFVDDCHFNLAGSREVGVRLANLVAERATRVDGTAVPLTPSRVTGARGDGDG